MIQFSDARSYQRRNKKSLAGAGLLLTLSNTVIYMVAKLQFVKQISRERNNLSHLSDYQLRDIGLTRDQVDNEIKRGVFDLPSARFGEFGYQRHRAPEHVRLRSLPKD